MRALERLSKAVRKRGRAMSMDVNERSSVGMWVRPNDHVDVLGTFRDPNSNQMVAVTLLQNVIVLATGQTTAATQSSRARQEYGTVTLLVLPEEAEILVLAQELGLALPLPAERRGHQHLRGAGADHDPDPAHRRAGQEAAAAPLPDDPDHPRHVLRRSRGS